MYIGKYAAFLISGVRRTSESSNWQLTSLWETAKGTKDTNIPMNSVARTDASETGLLQSNSSRAQFRDYEKRDTRRKSLCIPILDNCLIPEDSLELGQRFVEVLIMARDL